MNEQFTFPDASVDVQAADASKPPRITIAPAYSGGMMAVAPHGPLVIALDGLEVPASVVLLADHKAAIETTIGAGIPSIENGQLNILGTITPGSPAADRVVALAKGDTTLSASVGCKIVKARRIPAGETFAANNRTFTAPAGGCVLVSQSVLKEVSVLPIGADSQASVSITAKQGTQRTMDPENVTITEPGTVAATEPGVVAPVATATVDPFAEQRRLQAAETLRVGRIRELCAGQHPTLKPRRSRKVGTNRAPSWPSFARSGPAGRLFTPAVRMFLARPFSKPPR